MLQLRKFTFKFFLFVSLMFLACGLVLNCKIEAQSDNYILEAEQHWDTFGVGGTCIPGGHNMAVADIDGDGVKEMITGGFAYYYLPNGSRASLEAPLKIWSWDGKNITLEKDHSWTGNIMCVYVGDADGDRKVELITSGSMRNDTGSYPSLRIWKWDGQMLVLKGSYEEKYVGSISVDDVDGDGIPEIIGVTRDYGIETESAPQLALLRWDGANLVLRSSMDCCDTKDARASSVFAYDLDNDGAAEVVTAGYGNDRKYSVGQLRVWQFNGRGLSLKDSVEWCMMEGVYSVDVAGNVMGNTQVGNVKVGDVDGDGVPEIITGGFTYDGTKVQGQLRIWNWSEGVLNLEKSHEWVNLDITQITSISINDVDGDGEREIVTSGHTAGYGSFGVGAEGKTRAELKVWSWDGKSLTLKQGKDWIVGESVSAWTIGTDDVDNDGVVEIVTVGCMETITHDCDPDLRIWSIATESAVLPYYLLATLGIVAIAIIVIAFLLIRKRRKLS
jgi:hypothetical protein